MKKTLKLDVYLTEDGELEIPKTVLRDYYKKLSKGETKRDKEANIKLNLVLYPEFFYSPANDPPGAAEIPATDHIIAARIQNTTPEAIKMLHNSRGTIKTKDFSNKVIEIGS